MKDIYTVLGLNSKTASVFTLDLEPVKDNIGVRRIINAKVRKLEEIEQSFFVDSGRPEYSNVDIEEVIEKVKSYSLLSKNGEWTLHELKLITYYIARLSNNEKQFSFALNLLSLNWRNSFFSGLVYSILNGWTIWKSNIRKECANLLKEKLISYQGQFPKYVKLKQHIDFFDEAGPARISSLLNAKKLSMDEAPKMLGLTPPNIRLTYFSDVIISYIKNRNSDLDEIKELLDRHTLDRTKKLVLCFLIEEADKNGDTYQQAMLCRRAREIMNYDVTIEATWAPFSGASESEKNTLKHCYELVTAWYARRSVETFFEIACQDRDRRNFWLKYVHAVHNFKIVGSESVKTLLRRDGRINDALRGCFIESKSRTSQTSALVLYIKDKVFVEFSDTGALYVYNTNRKVISMLKTIKTIERSEDLKQPSIGPLVQQESGWYGDKYFTHSAEGRLPHSGYWQERLESWLKEIIKLKPDINRKSSNNVETVTQKRKTQVIQQSLFPADRYESSKNSTTLSTIKGSYDLPQYNNLTVDISSKLLGNGRLRIVSTYRGYCIHMMNTNNYYLIEPTIRRYYGSIIVGTEENDKFRKIMHTYDDFTFILGYIKIENSSVLFKRKNSSATFIIPY